MAQTRKKKKTKTSVTMSRRQRLRLVDAPASPASPVSPVLQSRLPAFSWHELISTGFFSGYLPKAPGTWGSLFALLLYVVTVKLVPGEGLMQTPAIRVSWWALLLAGASTAAGIYSAGKLAQQWREDDPAEVVIDEFAGMFFAVSFVTPNLVGLVAAFVFFRLFDVWKPGPIHSLQNLPGGYGIVLDDVLAGICAALAALATQQVWLKFI